MLRSGIVKSCTPTQMRVELLPIPGCSGCERQRKAGYGPGHCGIDLLGLGKASHRHLIDIDLTLQQSPQHPPLHPPLQSQQLASQQTPGSRVEIQIPEPTGLWLALALRVYGLPTAGLIAGAGVGNIMSERMSIALCFLGLCAGLWLGRRFVHVPQSMVSLRGQTGPVARIVDVEIVGVET